MKTKISFSRNWMIAISLVILSLIAIALIMRGVKGTNTPTPSMLLLAPASTLTTTSTPTLLPTPTPSQQLEMAVLSGNTPPAVPTTTPSQQSETMYIGSVKLNWAAPGIYSDTLTAPAGELPELGSIDLGFLAYCSDGELSGYVDLRTTLVFPGMDKTTTEQSETPLAVGPAISGTCSEGKLEILSNKFEQTTGAGQSLERQFLLIGTLYSDSNSYKGEYRETLWGYGPQPITVVGDFELLKANGHDYPNP